MVFDILSKCHHRIAHRGRQKTEKWIAEIYSKVNTESCEYFCFSLPFSRRAKTHNHRSETRCKSSSSWNIPFLDWSWSYGFQKLPMWMWTKAQLDYKIILLITTQSLLMFTPSITNLLMKYWMKFKSIVQLTSLLWLITSHSHISIFFAWWCWFLPLKALVVWSKVQCQALVLWQLWDNSSLNDRTLLRETHLLTHLL